MSRDALILRVRRQRWRSRGTYRGDLRLVTSASKRASPRDPGGQYTGRQASTDAAKSSREARDHRVVVGSSPFLRKVPSSYAILDFDSVIGPLAYRFGCKHFFRRRPVGLDPSPVVAAIAIGRSAALKAAGVPARADERG